VANSLWKRLWTGRKTDFVMDEFSLLMWGFKFELTSVSVLMTYCLLIVIYESS